MDHCRIFSVWSRSTDGRKWFNDALARKLEAEKKQKEAEAAKKVLEEKIKKEEEAVRFEAAMQQVAKRRAIKRVFRRTWTTVELEAVGTKLAHQQVADSLDRERGARLRHASGRCHGHGHCRRITRTMGGDPCWRYAPIS